MLYPKSNEARTVLSLDGLWNFQLDEGQAEKEKWESASLPSPELVSVPASYNDQFVSEKVRDHYGWAYYQRDFEVPESLKDQRIVLRFGSVTHQARVWLNGEQIAAHKGGFLPFEIEITDKLRPGKNQLTVACDNRVNYGTLPIGNEVGAAFFGSDLPDIPAVHQTQVKPHNAPNFDFFNYAGIHRPVKLYTTPSSFIEDVELVPEKKDGIWSVKCKVTAAGTPGDDEVSIEILDEEGKCVAKGQGQECELVIDQPHLWQPGNAYLYTAKISYGKDQVEETFGLRTIRIEGTKFLINDKPFYFKGFGKHEDCEVNGRGYSEVMNIKDLNLMKWIHANSFRTSHYPYAEEMLDLCDRMGIVVIDETSAVGLNFGWNDEGWKKFRTHDHHKQVIKDLIARDKNHPCVAIWSIANEPDTEKQPEQARDYFMPLYHLAHECDPQNRPVSLVICQNDYTRDRTAPEMDIILANRYYGWYVFSGDLDAAKQAMSHEMEYWKGLNKPWMISNS